MIFWPVQRSTLPVCPLCRMPDAISSRALPEPHDFAGEMVLTHVNPNQEVIDWVLRLNQDQRRQVTLQIHRHHWHEHASQLFTLKSLGVKTETLIDNWRDWDPIVLRDLWTSDRIVILLNKNIRIWDLLNQCPKEALRKIYFAKPQEPKNLLATEKILRLFLDIEGAFPEVSVKIISIAPEEIDPPSVEWELRRFSLNHRFLATLLRVIHAFWPLRLFLWVPFLFLCVMQNSMRGNIRQVRSFIYRVQGRSKAVLVFSYWAFRRLLSCLKIWRLEVWTLRLWTWLAFWRLGVYAQRLLTVLGLWRFAVYGQRLWTRLGLWRLTVALQKIVAQLKFWKFRMWAYRLRTRLGLWRIPMYLKRIGLALVRAYDRLEVWRIGIFAQRLWAWIGIWRLGVIAQRLWAWIGIWRLGVFAQSLWILTLRLWSWIGVWRLGVLGLRMRTLVGFWRIQVFGLRLLSMLELWRIRALLIRIYWRLNMVRFWVSDLRWLIFRGLTQVHWYYWPWNALKYLVGRYLMKPYYMIRYQYETRLRRPRLAKLGNE